MSFLLNLFLLTLIVTGLSFSVKKKEEIKITLLESPSFEVAPSKTTSLEEFEKPPSPEKISSPIPPLPKPKPSQEVKKELDTKVKKRETYKTWEKEGPLRENLEEEKFLRERLLALQKRGEEKNKSLSEEENFLTKGIQALQKEKASPTSVSAGKLSEEYLLLIKRKLQTHFEVPIYLKNKENLSAIVEIQVNSSGEIIKITYLKKSEDPTFNKAVEKCLAMVNPLPINQNIHLKIEFRAQGITKVH
ncbi:MAG: TonB C-terminal domain-containing protein [Caldimicrobium sp.]